ncbi:hypothetical protein A1F97_06692 [Pyrenophora tritici-repentis]|nr:hypothetical protein L13192_05490 [Pyrenophora tritici-repentis]KAI1681570.1 hypothetical protein KJE20_08441 [Pyrenophora tritici-repentis]PZD38465.1 hypothetical protein A1F97_06692 [Pyrenophora tritici-repentis]
MADKNDKPSCSHRAPMLAGVLEIRIADGDESMTFIISTALLEAHAPKLAQNILEQRRQGSETIELTCFDQVCFDEFVKWLKEIPNDTSTFKASRASLTNGLLDLHTAFNLLYVKLSTDYEIIELKKKISSISYRAVSRISPLTQERTYIDNARRISWIPSNTRTASPNLMFF